MIGSRSDFGTGLKMMTHVMKNAANNLIKRICAIVIAFPPTHRFLLASAALFFKADGSALQFLFLSLFRDRSPKKNNRCFFVIQWYGFF